eukprot:447030-Hanusia_phi.AAC.2
MAKFDGTHTVAPIRLLAWRRDMLDSPALQYDRTALDFEDARGLKYFWSVRKHEDPGAELLLLPVVLSSL